MKKRKIVLFILPIFIIIGIYIYSYYIDNKKTDIEAVLKTNSYSYLSSNAKEYIKNYYYATGEILLTEKNKVSGEEYLNPDYVEYLANESDNNTGYIPNALVYDYDYNYEQVLSKIDNLPQKYDSRNVNGNNYVTVAKQQYAELCWDYAFTSVIETKLLKENLKNDYSSLDLSERMMDYATTDPISVIDIGKNPYFGKYVLDSLASGGNNFRYSSALVNGLFPIDEKDWKYEEEYMKKVKSEDIYDFNKINYQVNEIKFLKDNNYNVGLDESTNKVLKQHIIDNGSIALSLRVGAGHNYISYKVTEDERLNSNENYNKLYYKDASAIYQSNDHMVAIIGWDDNYVHNVCVLDDGQLRDALNDNGQYSCSNGTLKTINGAWIIKDSASSLFHYVAYETVNSEYYAVTDISYRDWDNVYSPTNNDSYTLSVGNAYVFSKQSNAEKVKSIKFYTNKNLVNVNVYINTYDGEGEKLLTTLNYDVAGMYTVPIDEDFILSSDKFSIRVFGLNQFSIFTSNFNDNKVINIDDTKVINSFNYQGLLDNYSNVIVISGTSRNVNENINYVIKDSNDKDVTSSFNITRNYSVGNYINSLIKFNNDVPIGKYTGYAYINDILYDTFKIDIGNYMENIVGDGTEENPFIITNPIQLDMMRLNQYNYYKLGNDIDLTYDTQNENGLFYNDGLGWEPISYSNCTSGNYSKVYCSDGFSGIFDGDNHKIIGLYINRPNEDIVGLFKNTYNTNYSGLNFRNLTLTDVNISGKNYVGGLIGYAYGTTYERTLIFENISVTGSISGNDYVGGLIGYFNGGTGLKNYLVSDTLCAKRHCLNNLFNSSKIKGNNYVGGIVGLLKTQDYYSSNVSWRSTIDAYNWQNNGIITSNNNASGLVGHVVIDNGNIITLNNSINTGITKGNYNAAIVNDIECNSGDNTDSVCSLGLNNIYYTNDIGYKNNDLISANNVKKYNIVDLTDKSIYNSFTDFHTFYKMETVNNIKRIPFLKNAYIEYSSANDILIDEDKEVNLYDYINGSDNITYSILDNSIASIDDNGNITPLKNGVTTIHITSYYDGYDNNINLTVNLPEEAYTITYNLNGGTVENPTTYTASSDTFSLNRPTKEGYIFTGWTGSNGNTPELDVIIQKGTSGNLIYTANWEPLKYSVIFNSNGGTGKMEKQEFIYGVSQKLSSALFEKAGYNFVGWNTKKDATGVFYSDKQEINITNNLTLYAIWQEKYSYIINKYSYDDINKYIDKVDINTTVDEYKKNIDLNVGYSIEVEYKMVDGKKLLYTGAKTKIYNNGNLINKYTNIIRGEVTGDGKINYLDYVSIYNHIQKVKHPELTKKELKNEYLVSGDISLDGKINYLDYVKIYNKIKELKGGN